MTALTIESEPMLADLVRPDRVHRSLYTDEHVLAEERRLLFGRLWVYVGHESQIPTPGDYLTTWIGTEPVILVRDGEGRVRALSNRCAHRGATVCQAPAGNATFFRCEYHGWSYRCDGSLVGVPFRDGYPASFDLADHGLAEVPCVEAYRGFVFARLRPDGPSLLEHLGHARPHLDAMVDRSPVGELQVRSGLHRVEYAGNWKLAVENAVDGYHPSFTHRVVVQLQEARRARQASRQLGAVAASFRDASPIVTRDLGGGHVMLDGSGYQNFGPAELEQIEALPGGAELLRSLRERYTDEELVDLGGRAAATFNGLVIFPNLILQPNQIRTVRPLAVDRTEILYQPTSLVGLPDELHAFRLRRFEEITGPGGLASADDAEMFERVQRGLQASTRDWLLMSRGLEREGHDEIGAVGQVSDETAIRGIYRGWRAHVVAEAAR
jgi:phenylpropionate dioxygenase-like ring-hydroxylating dioxygenase large terminal subunit